MSDTTPPPPGGPGQPNPYGGYGGPPPTGPGHGYGGGGPVGQPPPNHLVWAILTTVLCCLPLGVVSIVFAAQVNSKWSAGDVQGAQDASRKARLFALWGTIIGAVVVVGYVLLVAVFGMSAIDQGQIESS